MLELVSLLTGKAFNMDQDSGILGLSYDRYLFAPEEAQDILRMNALDE